MTRPTAGSRFADSDDHSADVRTRHGRRRGPGDPVLHVRFHRTAQGRHPRRPGAVGMVELRHPLARPVAGRADLVHGRHRLVEGRHEHPLRTVEPGRVGAVLRRPVRSRRAVPAARAVRDHLLLRGGDRTPPPDPRGRVGFRPVEAPLHGLGGRVGEPRDHRPLARDQRHDRPRRLRPDRDADDRDQPTRPPGQARLDGPAAARRRRRGPNRRRDRRRDPGRASS